MKFVNAHNIPYTPSNYLTFNDVCLMPQYSKLESRNDPQISLSTKLTSGCGLNVPIISANMDTVTELDMVKAMGEHGCMGILHRFYKSKDKFLTDCQSIIKMYGTVCFSIGINVEEFSNIQKVLDMNPTQPPVVCLDVAHGHMQKCLAFIKQVKTTFRSNIQLIGGNVTIPMAVQDLILSGVDAVKIGQGNGSACTTRMVTGHGIPQLTAIIQARHTVSAMKSNAAIIADGGIKTSGDIVKALAAGADSVMIGNLLAGTDECPGASYEQAGKKWKSYRGQSSQDFLDDIGKSGVAPEGEAYSIECRGSVRKIIKNLIGGIRSGMTYTGVTNLVDLYDKAVFLEVTNNGYIEGTPHGKTSN